MGFCFSISIEKQNPNRFKLFNDEHGHVSGDLILKAIARTLTANARPFDLFGRWGGEEFLGIIRNVDAESLAGIGERMRVLIEKTRVTARNTVLNATVSVGATLAVCQDKVETLLKRADDLLYASKEAGRNRLTLG